MFEPRWQCLSKHRGRSHTDRQAGGHEAVGRGVKELTEGVCQGWRSSPSAWSHKAIMGERGEIDSP